MYIYTHIAFVPTSARGRGMGVIVEPALRASLRACRATCFGCTPNLPAKIIPSKIR